VRPPPLQRRPALRRRPRGGDRRSPRRPAPHESASLPCRSLRRAAPQTARGRRSSPPPLPAQRRVPAFVRPSRGVAPASRRSCGHLSPRARTRRSDRRPSCATEAPRAPARSLRRPRQLPRRLPQAPARARRRRPEASPEAVEPATGLATAPEREAAGPARLPRREKAGTAAGRRSRAPPRSCGCRSGRTAQGARPRRSGRPSRPPRPP
jgi:hypothetical protein